MKLVEHLASMPRLQKQAVAAASDVVLSVLACWMAFSLRLETYHFPTGNQWYVYALTAVLFIPFFVRLGLYRAIFRYSGIASLRAVAIAVLLFGLTLFVILIGVRLPNVPRSVSILQPILFWGFVTLSRIVAAQLLLQLHSGPVVKRRPTLIYGAGDAGAQAAGSLVMSGQFGIVGFIDDDKKKNRQKLNGVDVWPRSEIPNLIEKRGVTDILLALPGASLEQRRDIVASLARYNVRVRSIPELSKLAVGQAAPGDLQELQIIDLLDRKPIADPSELEHGTVETVLVTGAGGSIGSELCRQLLQLEPRCLVMLDHNEYGLYTIHREISEYIHHGKLDCEAVALLGSVRDRSRLDEIVSRYKPQAIYHAAAYKHVPLVEDNPVEGVTNNVEGTWNVADLALKHGVGRFVLISTDKAVRPTNTMGASKRMAELVVQALAEEASKNGNATVFSMVRFGNVLGSSGSVVPLFTRQIRQGGPLTITDPEVTRYFMTIPEAVSLVLQAGNMARGGEVFVLDMGEPVKIIDLARKMIRLSGMTEKTAEHPEGDIAIHTIGLRPGEKLYEELLIGEDPKSTANPHIMMAREAHIPWPEFVKVLHDIRTAAVNNNAGACIEVLKKVVVGFDVEQRDNSQG